MTSPVEGTVEVRVAVSEEDLKSCFAVRSEVFVVEQSVPESIEYDAYDADAVHVLAVDADGAPLGTGRLLHGPVALGKTGDLTVGSLGRLAVAKSARGLGVGVALVRAIEAEAARRGWPRSIWARRRMRWASTSGSATWPTARNSRTRASPTARCDVHCRSRGSSPAGV